MLNEETAVKRPQKKVLLPCPFCYNFKLIFKANEKRTKSCGCMKGRLISYANVKHGGYSKYTDPMLNECIRAVIRMRNRVRNPRLKNYKSICTFFDDPRKSGIWLYRKIGKRPHGYSVEKTIGGRYFCGNHEECDQCRMNANDCTILGWSCDYRQALTRRTTINFRKGNEVRPLSRLGELLKVEQKIVNSLWAKTNDIGLSNEDRWSSMRASLIQDHDCQVCSEIRLISHLEVDRMSLEIPDWRDYK